MASWIINAALILGSIVTSTTVLVLAVFGMEKCYDYPKINKGD